MNLQERLGKLRRDTLWEDANRNEFYTVDKTDYDWLISTVEEQQKEIERLNKALENILNYEASPIEGKEKEEVRVMKFIARQALEGIT